MTPLDLVREPLRESLKRSEAALSALGKAPDDHRMLASCHALVAETLGAFKMVEHQDAVSLFERLEAHLADPERRAALLLETELDQSLQQLRALRRALRETGIADDSEFDTEPAPTLAPADLAHAFFASWGSSLPQTTSDRGPIGALADERRKFERGLLKVLQSNGDRSALIDMALVVQRFAHAVRSVTSRGFWNAAEMYLLNLHRSESAVQQADKRTCAALNMAMRRAAAGNDEQEVALLNELFATISHANAVTESMARAQSAIAALKETPVVEYEELELDTESRAKCIEALSVLRDALERVEIGETAARADATRAAESFARRCERTNVPALIRIAQMVAQSVQALVGSGLQPRPAQALAQVILLSESVLSNGARLSSGRLSYVEKMALGIAHMGASPGAGARAVSILPEYTQDAVIAACEEVRTRLAAVEATLEAFFASPDACRDQLDSIAPALMGMERILVMLGAESARVPIERCKEGVAQCMQSNGHDNADQFGNIADCVVELNAVVDIVALGQAPGETPYPFSSGAASSTDAALNSGSTESMAAAVDADAEAATVLANLVSPASADLPQNDATSMREERPTPHPVRLESSVVSNAIPVEYPTDVELLGIFLEEAKEVLTTIAAHLPDGAGLLNDKQKATDVRRAFHTLKGSGRMVGLERFAAAAWSVESALNRFLDNGHGLPESIAHLIATAHTQLSDWVAQFEDKGSAHVDAETIERLAARVHDTLPQHEPAAATTTLPPDAKAPIANPTPEQLSPKRPNGALWAIYQTEANKHIEVLRQGFSRLEADKNPQALRDLERAAHTLASSSGTMGIQAMYELGQALERFVVARARAKADFSAVHALVSKRVVDALELMLGQAAQHREVIKQEHLIAELTAIDVAPERAAVHDVLALTNTQEAPSLTKRSAADEEAKARSRRQFRPDDDIDAQLLPLFMEEAEDLVPRIGVALRAWHERPEDLGFAQELQRHFHTLKGSARMAGAMGIGELLHSMETRTEQVQRQGRADVKWFEQIEGSFDRLHLLLERVAQPPHEPERADQQRQSTPHETPRAEVVQDVAVNGVPLLKVRADLLERVTSKFTELSISQARGETLVKTLAATMHELDGDLQRLREHLRELEIQAESNLQARVIVKEGANREFDPLELDRFTKLQELTRSMAEALEDFSEMQLQFRYHTDSFGRAYVEQSRLSRDLYREMTRMRLLPFSTIAERLHRVVRQTAKELGKRANLDIHGVATEIDRIVLERMTAPLEHLLRNAVVHGLEDEAGRIAANKPVQGEIRIEVRQSHGETLVTVHDDGMGLDWERIRRKAIERGLVPENTSPNSRDLIECVFASGFSTAQELTQLAGRGVGLDVVRSEVKALGGDVRLETHAGQGAAFTLHLPMTLALLRVVIVVASGRLYALPASMIEHVQSLGNEAFQSAVREKRVQWRDRNYALHYLPQLLGYDNLLEPQTKRHTVLLLRAGGDVMAISVDGIVGNREIVTKPLASQLARVEGVTGAALLSTGEIALVLNPLAIHRRETKDLSEAASATAMLPAFTKRSVLVVDDSVTVRKITGRFLAREGFDVHTAKNGLEALEQLANFRPDVMLVDIEMPQMDGFEFTRAIRSDAKHQDIPIIMITSRTADKHRQHALDLGVNVFLGKPYTDKDLLNHIATQLRDAA